MTKYYWGPIDSSITFCEDKYVNSKYIAEYYNTISGILYLLVGLYFINSKIKKIGYVIFIMGLGTMCLHGTLRWYGQWSDELSMLTLIYIYIKNIYYDISYDYLYLIVGSYVTFHENHNVFLFLFISLLIYQYIATQYIIIDYNTRYWRNLYLIFILSGFLCWILDRICFTKTINYHVFWHILSGFASFSGSMVYYENRKLLDKKAEIISKWYRKLIIKRKKKSKII